jgi:hypothetical protein
MLIALYARPRSLRCPASASSSAILRRDRRRPATGLPRRPRRLVITAGDPILDTQAALQSGAATMISLIKLRDPPHLASSGIVRGQPDQGWCGECCRELLIPDSTRPGGFPCTARKKIRDLMFGQHGHDDCVDQPYETRLRPGRAPAGLSTPQRARGARSQ